jgi:asparagine synthase (glutamine-hydrolysing)
MSAICGKVQRDGSPVAASTINQMMTALDVYGPDGAAVWCEGTVGLGHQMLYITPESLHEHLPWRDNATEMVITADARLDNREELYTKLHIPVQEGHKLSDSQIILRAYQKWGEQCPYHLLGDFAFAIWDQQERKLFCARDVFGIRPFFYYSSPNCFIFASDLNALLVLSEVPQQLNEPLLAAFLQQEDITFAKKSQTFYEGVKKLLPSHSLTITPTQQKLQCYWSPDKAAKIRFSSESDYVQELQRLLQQAVECRLRSAFPVGAHLSGGLDSSSIAVLANRFLKAQGKALQGFSWSPPLTTPIDSPGDERLLVKELSDLEQIECHYVSLTGEDLIKHRTRNFLVEPTEMLQFEQKVQSEITARNIRVVLSGWGGDEAITFNGRGYFAELFLKGKWLTLYRELTLRGKLHGLGLKGQLLQKVIIPLLPDSLLSILNRISDEKVRYSEQSAYLTSQFSGRIKPLVEQLPHLTNSLREQVGVRQNQLLLLEDGHLTDRIESWALSGALNGFVYSYPLLDRRIVEFALGIPVDWFFKNGWKRYLFRAATADILPDTVRWNKTKLEVASFAQLKACNVEIRQEWKDICLSRLKAKRHSKVLADLINLEKLEKALTGEEPIEAGFWPAIMLVATLPETPNSIPVSEEPAVLTT